MKYNVAILKNVPGIYTYQSNQEIEPGQLVLVEFSLNQHIFAKVGFLWSKRY